VNFHIGVCRQSDNSPPNWLSIRRLQLPFQNLEVLLHGPHTSFCRGSHLLRYFGIVYKFFREKRRRPSQRNFAHCSGFLFPMPSTADIHGASYRPAVTPSTRKIAAVSLPPRNEPESSVAIWHPKDVQPAEGRAGLGAMHVIGKRRQPATLPT
jgi:hypothetical protein